MAIRSHAMMQLLQLQQYNFIALKFCVNETMQKASKNAWVPNI